MKNLDKLLNNSTELEISDEDRLVIFSDLHIGNGGSNDNFARNRELFKSIITNYYLTKDFSLILNGDIEDLYKFSIEKVRDNNKDIYELFKEFKKKGKLYKIYGNHDFELSLHRDLNEDFPVLESLLIKYNDNKIFIYHGHQTASKLEQYSKIILFFNKLFLKTVNNPLIKMDNKKKYKTEVTAYKFSKEKKIISILGHTHRPLFESLSKHESLKITLEHLIKSYVKGDEEKKQKIYPILSKYKEEYEKLNKNGNGYLKSSVYSDNLLVPCLFNSGSATGSGGITCIEIKKGKIYLAYWFDINRTQRYLNSYNVKIKKMGDTNYFKAILKKDSLEYLFTRIKLL